MKVSASAFDDRSTIELFATSSSSLADQVLGSLKSVLSKVIAEGFSSEQVEKA